MSILSYCSIPKMVISLAVTYFTVSNYIPVSHGDVIAIAGPLSTIAGILFGFVIASVSFFSTSASNSLIENMKSTGMYQQLINQLSHTGQMLITSCIFMVISIFSPQVVIYGKINIDYALLIVGFFFLCYGLLEFWTCWRKVHMVAKHM